MASSTDWLGTDQIKPPVGGAWDDPGAGLENFINRGFRLVMVFFALYTLLNFILAAYNFINAQGEAKNIEKAKKLIMNSTIGLVLLSMVFVVAGVIGAVFFGSWDTLLDLQGTITSITQ